MTEAENIKAREWMERWAKWRAGARASESLGLPRVTIIGRVLDGMPSTKCTLCDGQGKVPGWKVHAHAHFVQCPQCGGAGKIKADPHSSTAKTTRCPQCKDHKKRKDRPGEIMGVTCYKCHGAGQITVRTEKVNPAFIRSTRFGSGIPSDPLCLAIDRAVCALEFQLQEVILLEYGRSGTQQDKADRLRISQAHFSRLLDQAIEVIFRTVSQITHQRKHVDLRLSTA